MSVQFINNLNGRENGAAHAHDHSDGHTHSHDGPGDHGHTHEHLEHAGTGVALMSGTRSKIHDYLCIGKYHERDLPEYSQRNFEERGFTVGIGG